MLIAPHPDDESLACGISLQRARAAGATVRVVYLTDGENNPWPQRLIECKWRLDRADRERLGRMRRQEALSALRVLGIDTGNVAFLGLPDQGLTDLLLHDPAAMARVFENVIVDFAPTHLFFPSLSDIHADHNATAVAMHLALRNLETRMPAPATWVFAVHGRDEELDDDVAVVPESRAEAATKLAAVEEHRSQLKLSGRRFRDYCRRPEYFHELERDVAWTDNAFLRTQWVGAESITLTLQLPRRLTLKARPRVLVLAHRSGGDPLGVILTVPLRSQHVDLVEVATQDRITSGFWEITAGNTIRLTIDPSPFSRRHPLYVKLDHRPIFFDTAGWIEIATPPLGLMESAPARSKVVAAA